METSNESILVLHSQMGQGRTDYEAVYTLSPEISLSELHNHHFYEFYFHVHGGRRIYADGEVYELEPNTFFVFPPFCLHGITNEPHLINYERAFLYLSTDLLQTLGLQVMDFQKIFNGDRNDRLWKYRMDPALHSECVALIRTIQSISASQTASARLLAYSHIIRLLLHAANTVSNDSMTNRPVPIDALARKVAQYINEHYATPLSLDELSAHFSVSKSNLCHRFAENYHCSIYQYTQSKRISRAKELIVSGVPFTSIAYECGFGDYSTFLRAFSKYAHMTPTAYRNQYHGKQ